MLRWFNSKKKKDNKTVERTSFKFDSKAQATLKSLFELPVQTQWLSHDEIEKINRDSTVISARGRRKSATLKKEINIVCEDKDIKKNLELCFNYDVLNSMLDIPFQGFGVQEIKWVQKDKYFYPELIERNYKDFMLDDKRLKFVGSGMPEDVAIYKAVYGTYEAKPDKPYGQPLYNPLFWLIEFKNASLEFWIELLERFGTPWVIAKTEGDKDTLADEIYNMLGGDGAVIDTDDEIDIKTADKVGNFKEIIDYIDNQIRELINGGNLTGQVTGGSQAAATVHNDIREDLAQADQNIINKLIRQVVELFKEGNYLTIEIEAKLKDKDDPNKALADRDKVIYDMGYTPTQEYIESTYNIKVEKKEEPQNIIPNSTNISKANLYKFNKDMPQDELENQTNKIDLTSLFTFQEQILKTIDNSNTYEELFENLVSIYPDIDTKDLEDSLSHYLSNSQILGAVEVAEENPNG